MSLYDDASILMFPSGYKDSKLYSLKPTDGTGDLSFARSSSGTRVNEQGLIEKYLLGSELITNGDFDTNLNFWSTSSWWVWNALGAYHPSSTTHKPLYQQCAEIGKQYYITFDINIVSGKAKFSLGSSTGSTTQVIANNLQTGSYSYLVTAAAEYIVFNREFGFNAEFYVDNVSVKEAQTNNVPRIDYTGGGCGKLLIEPQSTNLVPYSEDFNNSSWFISRATVNVNAAISPDGGNTADLLIPNSGVSGWSGLSFPNASVSSGVDYSGSVYVKSGGYNWLQIGGSSPRFNATFANVNLLDGSLGNNNIDVNVVDVGNGWYRISITDSAASTTTGAPFFVAVYDSDVSTRLPDSPGDGISGVYLYGAQVEQGEYASSYIPTSGTTATRTQDTSLTTSSNIAAAINGEEGVLFIDFERLGLDFEDSWMGLYNGSVSSNFRLAILYRKERIIGYVRVNGSWQAIMQYYGTWTMPRIKVALKYKANDFALWVNGVEGVTDTSGSTFGTGVLDTVNLGDHLTSSNPKFNARINTLAVFPTALSDEDLTELTTL